MKKIAYTIPIKIIAPNTALDNNRKVAAKTNLLTLPLFSHLKK
ncbi:hypothetical protein ES708_03269 [subsurface metagenome]